MPSLEILFKGKFRIGSSIIGIWAFLEMGLIERSEHIVFSTILWSRTGNICVRAAQRPEMVQVIRPGHPAHGGCDALHGTV